MKTKIIKYYTNPKDDNLVTEDELRDLDPKIQMKAMNKWFKQNYDKREHYISSEEDEISIGSLLGRTIDVNEVLFSEFSGIVPAKYRDTLVRELIKDSDQWVSMLKEGDIDSYFAGSIVLNSEYYHNFVSSMSYVSELLKLELDIQPVDRFRMLLYANVITALETYLSDAFIYTVLSEERFQRKLVESESYFREIKISFSEIFYKHELMKEQVKDYLMKIAWHDILKARSLFFNTLGIKFPDELKPLLDAVIKRHDIIHRNGKNNEGKKLRIGKKDVQSIITTVTFLVEEIDTELSIQRGSVVRF